MNTAVPATALRCEAVDYDPFAGGALALVVPTTEPQREIWLADQLGMEASLAFNLSVSLLLRGRLDVQALRASLQDLVDRHEALRANVGPDGETFCVLERFEIPCPMSDLADVDDAARKAAIGEHLRASVETPFALGTQPLFRAQLLRLAQDEHLLVLAAHHIVCDGWSWWVVVRELGALYGQRSGAVIEPLAPSVSFADYALMEAGREADAAHATDEAYWLSRFQGVPPVLELPTDRPRPAQRTFASAREDHVLDAELLGALRRTGARRGVSLFATLLAGFSGLLSRLSGQSDIVVGIPAAGQPVAGHDNLVGHCVNALPLRFDVEPLQSFAQSLDGAQATLLDALEHQRYTFGTLLKKLRIRRDPSRMPLLSVLFNLDQALDKEGTAFPGLAMEFDSNPRSFETFELFVNAVQVRGELRLECQYNRDLFDGATVRRWLRAYETLLRAAVEHEDACIGHLPLVDAAARAELLALQPEPVAFDLARRVHEYFEAQCDRAPERIAVHAGSNVLSYAELEQRANRIAQALRSHGVRRGALVGIAVDRGVDMLAALLGVLKAGAGYVPLDPQFPHERLAYMAADAGLALLLTSQEHAAHFDLRGRPVLLVDDVLAGLAATPAERIGRDAGAASPEDVAYVIYTSGSTGRPKGVRVPHRAVSNFLDSMRIEPGLGALDRLVAVTTLSFDIAVLELFLPLAVGAEVFIADRETAGDGVALAAMLESSRATVMQATPSTWRLLLDAGWRGTQTFKALCGGEPLAPELASSLLQRCSTLWNLYGPTETTVWSTCAHVAPATARSLPDVNIGRPIANTRVWIVDAHGEPCPIGVPGELLIGGDGVTLGYLDRPELTAERFVADRFSERRDAQESDVPEPLLYRTGDRGRWRPDGNLEHLGRLDHQVKVRGYRIELGEIEANLAAHGDIANVLATVREDQPGDQRLVAYVVANARTAVDEASLRIHLRDLLPAYMVPQHFVVLDELPLLPNGKIDRNSLPAPAAAVKTAPSAAHDTAAAAVDPRVRYLSEVWTELLGMPAGADDNFFELGGHSMLAVQMASRVERDTGVRIKLIRLGAETLAQVASGLPLAVADSAPSAGVGGRISNGLRRLFGLAAGSRQ
jgi:amino acid adenylation domain-containing protein